MISSDKGLLTEENRIEPASGVKQNRSASSSATGQSFRTRDAMNYRAWVAKAAKQPMVLEAVDLGPLGAEDVEVAVEHCGLCHSDLSILNNDFGISQHPAILGHEIVGRVAVAGSNAKGLKVGQHVGVGWNSGSCMHCHQCMSRSHHLCQQVRPTIVGHRGGFATHVRSHWAFAIPLPERLNVPEAGPLLCGGASVFAPLVMYAEPTDRVGIIGVGGLGHMAVKFAAAYGCDVTALKSSESKFDEAKGFGASRVVSSRDSAAIKVTAKPYGHIQ
jgi:alcohol/geraniol dehydrogenase (NADP+)